MRKLLIVALVITAGLALAGCDPLCSLVGGIYCY